MNRRYAPTAGRGAVPGLFYAGVMGQLANVIGEVAAGRLAAGEAAARIRAMHLTLPPRPVPTVEDVLGAADDPYGPEADDDGHELSEALHGIGGRQITMDQYKVLLPAVTSAVQAARARAAGR